ncbi:hypothetical protein, partial [Ralstonia pseudosolanacearum]|uniref:hypothetical protein n=1 Tax=Ralstonia pseudosolanacearum TaxID=1310165 RepID=UPI0032216857
NSLATNKSHAWFENNVIYTVLALAWLAVSCRSATDTRWRLGAGTCSGWRRLSVRRGRPSNDDDASCAGSRLRLRGWVDDAGAWLSCDRG